MNQRYAFGDIASTPQATQPPTTWIMAEKGGALAAENSVNQGNTITANLQKGINMEASMTQDASITAAALSMITSMEANMTAANTLTGPMQMTMNLAANLAQSGDIEASLGLIAWCSANMNQTADMSASNLRGTLSMAANIVSYSEFTAEGVRDAVWNAVLANYPNSGSAGLALSTASSGGVDPTILASAVWAYVNRTLTANPGPTATDVSEAVWATALEGLTAEEIMRVLLAAMAGKRQGLGTATENYMAQDGVTPRITLAPDQNGNGTPVIDGTL